MPPVCPRLSFLGDGAAAPVLKDAPSHPKVETHFRYLYRIYQSCSFGHYPKLMTIDEARNLVRLVNPELCLSSLLSLHQDGSML